MLATNSNLTKLQWKKYIKTPSKRIRISTNKRPKINLLMIIPNSVHSVFSVELPLGSPLKLNLSFESVSLSNQLLVEWL
jgi:hypothetical protein